MRKGVTLIELVLSMVIIALVFTVIPKIIIATNKSFVSASKQDGIFNAVELMHTISSSPWDAKSYETFNILNVADGHNDLDCNVTSGYRKGGFVGGRNCLGDEVNATVYSSSKWGENNITDIDDFDSYDQNATASKCTGTYETYSFDPIVRYKVADLTIDTVNRKATVDFETMKNDTNITTSSNVKYISLSVPMKTDRQNSGCVKFDYYSANIGQIGIERKVYE